MPLGKLLSTGEAAERLGVSASYLNKLRLTGSGPIFVKVGTRVAYDPALARADGVVVGLLPDGKRDGVEWVARNPLRQDRRPGSFKVNLRTGKWGDFATGDKGGDLVSLAAYVAGVSQREAAIRLAESMGVDPYE